MPDFAQQMFSTQSDSTNGRRVFVSGVAEQIQTVLGPVDKPRGLSKGVAVRNTGRPDESRARMP